MRSRLISTLTLAFALATSSPPLSAVAQQPGKIWRIGLFHVGLDHVPPSLDPLRESLKVLGYEEGKNIHLDWRNLPDEEAARATAKEFVRNRVDLIVAFENQTARAAKAATSEIPVVFLHVTDPVAGGFVKSLARPGGNFTGFVFYAVDPGKRMELFKEIVPRLRRILLLIDPQDPVTSRNLAEIRKAAEILRIKSMERETANQADLERIFRAIKPGDVDGVLAASTDLEIKFSSVLIRLASEKRLPLATHRREWVKEGALFSYAPDNAAVGRPAAQYVDKILKGTKPADLPVEQPTKFELAVNMRTAKALGLTIPPSVLVRADQIIE